MQAFIIIIILAVTTFEYLIVDENLLPSIFRYAPEMLAIIATAVVVIAGIKSRFAYVRSAYWLIFGGLALVIACGAVVNELKPGPLFVALRTYIWAMPFFLLAASINQKPKNLRAYFFVLAVITLYQLPLAYDQRMHDISIGSTTGDHTYGTLMAPAALTLYAVCAACVVAGFYLRGKLGIVALVLLLAFSLGPTLLNESKGALIIAPIALFVVFVLGSRPENRIKGIVIGTGVIVAFGAIFIPVYDYFIMPRWGYGLIDFFTMEGRVEGYLDRGAGPGQTDVAPGKIGSIKIALSLIFKDISTAVFGVGIGNTADSALGSQFSGKYFHIYGPLVGTGAARLTAEIGLAGIGLVVLLHWNILKDTLYVARQDTGLTGALAVGWTGVITAMSIGLIYTNPIVVSALSALFWFFSGVITAKRMRVSESGSGNQRAAERPIADSNVLEESRAGN